jgi:hypothetical protein
LGNGSVVTCDIDTTTAANADQITVGGALTIPVGAATTLQYNLVGGAAVTVGQNWPLITASSHSEGFLTLAWEDPDSLNVAIQFALAWNANILSVIALTGDHPPTIPAQSFSMPADHAKHNITVTINDANGISGRVISMSVQTRPTQAQIGYDSFTHVVSVIPNPGASGTDSFVVKASDLQAVSTATLPITYTIPPPPVITSASATNASIGTAFTYQIVATNGPTAYGATGLPPGLTLDPVGGAITGSPTATGSYPVALSATNAGGTGTMTLNLAVLIQAPIITSALTASTVVSTAFSYQITASGSPTAFGCTGLPSGLNVDTASGIISGQANTVGAYTLNLSATNPGGTGSAALQLTVTAGSTTGVTGPGGGSAGGSGTGGGGGGGGGGCGMGASMAAVLSVVLLTARLRKRSTAQRS